MKKKNLTDLFLNLHVTLIEFIINLHDKVLFYPQLKVKYKNLCTTPQFVIDIGSNKGQSIDFFLKLNPNCKILSFEPNPILYHKLVGKYKENQNILLYNLGISDTNSDKIFYETLLNTTSSFEQLNYSSDYVKRKAKILGIRTAELVLKTYYVKSVSLPDFIIDSKIQDDIDIIKIDTEGHEYACLIGLFSKKINNKIKLIQIENHSNHQYNNQVDFSEIDGLLKVNNFFVASKVSHLYGDFYDYIYLNSK